MTQLTTLIDRFARRDAHVAIIGLGYVGLPLAVAYALDCDAYDSVNVRQHARLLVDTWHVA